MSCVFTNVIPAIVIDISTANTLTCFINILFFNVSAFIPSKYMLNTAI